MTPKALKALQGSIAKWEAIVAGTGHDAGPDNCALCQEFRHKNAGGGIICDGCPVKDATGEDGCADTPYDAYERADTRYNAYEGAETRLERDKFASEELAFLQSLLPKRAPLTTNQAEK